MVLLRKPEVAYELEKGEGRLEESEKDKVRSGQRDKMGRPSKISGRRGRARQMDRGCLPQVLGRWLWPRAGWLTGLRVCGACSKFGVVVFPAADAKWGGDQDQWKQGGGKPQSWTEFGAALPPRSDQWILGRG